MLKCHSCSGKFGLVGDPANVRKRVIERENNFQLFFLGQTKHIVKPRHCYTYALLSRRHNIILLFTLSTYLKEVSLQHSCNLCFSCGEYGNIQNYIQGKSIGSFLNRESLLDLPIKEKVPHCQLHEP